MEVRKSKADLKTRRQKIIFYKTNLLTMPEESTDHINFEELNTDGPFHNRWYTHIYTADPSAHVFNGKIYIYPIT